MDAWLRRIESLHPAGIALGLDRVAAVRRAMRLEPSFAVITVGGTNGKGSVCAMLESVLHAAGHRVGCYTSPHLARYNERVRIGLDEATDGELARAFAAVDAARGATALTYFEFGTLAALRLFVERGVDVAVLEVGLGGRLDAVNAFDADAAVVVSVDLDHMDYLGADREAIGHEKAGIFRPGRPAICADPAPPASLREHARRIGALWLGIGREFGYEREAHGWRYRGPHGVRGGLPYPALRGTVQLANAAAAITALDALKDRLPVAAGDLRTGLLKVDLRGRFQVLPGRPAVILDVAHNPHAARALSASLAGFARGGRTLAVFSMLGDKDIAGVACALMRQVDHWYVAAIEAPRGADADSIVRSLAAAGASAGAVTRCESVAAAYARACDAASGNDRILAFGSFYTVAAVLDARARLAAG
ncbi:MAG: bifunctional tetrahydrofolate synthase/dihydrofolate synthase [Burkholderiales bacterium]|nr:bifunctional tetrahydrofolate synthase/dihydrofolate synthase [Burkholderiales bacterium]